MSIHKLLNQFIGQDNAAPSTDNATQGIAGTLGKLAGNIPGGLAGGAAAGGIMALLVGNKSARKFAGKAVTYGGAAVLGGLAYKAFQSWRQNNIGQVIAEAGTSGTSIPDEDFHAMRDEQSSDFELTLVKAMIAAAKADDHIDAAEQQRIFQTVEQMDMSTETKAMVLDLLRNPISIDELVKGANNIEQKSELYLASCLAINPDHASEQQHLERLATALELPESLAQELQWQARKSLAEAA